MCQLFYVKKESLSGRMEACRITISRSDVNVKMSSRMEKGIFPSSDSHGRDTCVISQNG